MEGRVDLRNSDFLPMLYEDSKVNVMLESGEVLSGVVRVQTNALWRDENIAIIEHVDKEVT